MKRRPNNIFVVDTAQKYLKHSADFKLISFGQMEGIGCLQFPMKALAAELNKEKLRVMHSESMNVLFNKLKKNEPTGTKSKSLELWSSESEEEEAEKSFSRSSQKAKDLAEDELYEDSDAEDPLRNLYLK